MDNGCGANAINDKKKPSIVQREYILSWVWQIYYTYIQKFYSFLFFEKWYARHSGSVGRFSYSCRPIRFVCVWVDCVTPSFSHLRSHCLWKLFCVQLATEVSHYSLIVCREKKKNFMKNVRRDIHGEIMWRIKMGRKKCTIDTLKTNFSELVIVRVILVIR